MKTNRMLLSVACLLVTAALHGQDRRSARIDILPKVDQYLARGSADSARVILDSAIQGVARKKLRDPSRLIEWLKKRADIDYMQAEHASALKGYREAYALAREHRGFWSEETGKIALSAGNAALGLQDFPVADSMYRTSLAILRHVLGDDHLLTGWAYHDVGLASMYLGHYAESLACFEEALRIKQARLPADDEDIARTLTYLGFFYDLFGEHEQAELATEKAARITMAHYGPDHIGYYYAKNNLVQPCIQRGEVALAIESARDAIRGKKRLLKSGDYHNLATSYNWLGLAFQAAGQYDSARLAFERGLAIYDSLARPISVEQSHVLHNLGTNYLYAGNPEQGRLWLGRALSAKQQTGGSESDGYNSTRLMYGAALMDLGQYAEALDTILRGKALLLAHQQPNGRDYAYCLEVLSKLYAIQGDSSHAVEAALELSARSRESLLKATDYGSERELMLAADAAGRNVERLLALQYRFGLQDPEFLGRLSDEVIHYKGFVLHEIGRARRSLLADSASRIVFEQWNKAKSEVLVEHLYGGGSELRMTRVQHVADSLEKCLVRTNRTFARLEQLFTATMVCDALEEDEALIEFVRFKDLAGREERYAVLVFRHGEPRVTLVPLFAEDAMADGNDVDQRISGGSDPSLYDMIWKPILPSLASVRRIWYVPDGWIHRINIGALADGTGQLAFAKWDCIRLISSRSMLPDNRKDHVLDTAVLFGGIRFDGGDSPVEAGKDGRDQILLDAGMQGLTRSVSEDSTKVRRWPFLPGSRKEVEEVAGMLRDKSFTVQLHIGGEATEEAFVRCARNPIGKGSPDILHLSTHAYFFPPRNRRADQYLMPYPVVEASNHPMIRSGLLLAGANRTWNAENPRPPASADGILTALEIGQLDLSDTELAVLSACETGLGDIDRGEGVLGLVRGFRQAGCRRILVSLWRVPDHVTALLMTTFYDQWLNQGKSVHQALTGAQLAIRNAGFPPAFWAGFVVME